MAFSGLCAGAGIFFCNRSLLLPNPCLLCFNVYFSVLFDTVISASETALLSNLRFDHNTL